MSLLRCRTSIGLTGICAVVLSALAIGLSGAVGPVLAGEVGPSTQYCLQPRFNAADGANKNGTLNCTANDVRVANVFNVSPSTCTQGTNIEVLTFDAEVALSAGGQNATRTDLGFYWNTGTNKTNGARGGGTASCQIATIQSGEDGFLDTDGDACGDINAANNPLFAQITLTDVACQGIQDPRPGAPVGQLVLHLPYCTSWFIPGADDVCNGPLDAWAANAAKCKCEDNFFVPVIVQSPEASVTKRAVKATVRYEVKIENTSSTVAVRIKSLSDTEYGNITTTGHDGIVATTCAANETTGPVILADDNYTCTFDVEVPYPGSSTAVTDKVTAVLKATTEPFNETTEESNTVKVVVDLDAP